MAKVNYIKCDICGSVLNPEGRIGGFSNGYRIRMKIFNKLDICNNCFGKIKYLSMDKDTEEKCIDALFNEKTMRHFGSNDAQSAYYQGIEDCLDVLSPNILRKL